VSWSAFIAALPGFGVAIVAGPALTARGAGRRLTGRIEEKLPEAP